MAPPCENSHSIAAVKSSAKQQASSKGDYSTDLPSTLSTKYEQSNPSQTILKSKPIRQTTLPANLPAMIGENNSSSSIPIVKPDTDVMQRSAHKSEKCLTTKSEMNIMDGGHGNTSRRNRRLPRKEAGVEDDLKSLPDGKVQRLHNSTRESSIVNGQDKVN